MLLGTVNYGPHAFLHGLVLIVNSVNSTERFFLLDPAIDLPVHIHIPELPEIRTYLGRAAPIELFHGSLLLLGQRLSVVPADPAEDHRVLVVHRKVEIAVDLRLVMLTIRQFEWEKRA